MQRDEFKYLVKLDVLLDARLGAVSQLDSTYAKKLLANNWSNRESDKALYESDSFTFDQYKKLIEKGDKEVLANSFPTTITNLLYEFIKESLLEGIVGDSVNKHVIVVNTYPYSLNEAEREVIKEAIELKVPNVERCELVSVSPIFTTPGYLVSTGITHFIEYDFEYWLNMYMQELIDSPISSIVMVCPKLLRPSCEEVVLSEEDKVALANMSPFSALELQFVLYITLRFVDVKYFSLFEV